MKSSMLVDLERGNRLEVEYLSGTVVRLGAEAGVPTPTHRAIYAALKPFAAGGGVDFTGRVISQQLSDQLRQPFLVENRTGASGSIGNVAGDNYLDRSTTIILTG